MPRAATATATSTDLVDAAQHALDLVGEDPQLALDEADVIVAGIRRPRTPDEARAYAVAQRAAALALRSLGTPIDAERRLRRALVATRDRADAETVAEIQMTLAFILLDLGRTRSALASVDQSLGVLRGLKAARARTMRALALQRAQRPREAFAEYAAALPVLRRHHDDDWTARLKHNRALLHLELGEVEQAVKDLQWVRDHDLSEGRAVDAADALFNIGIARTLNGDIPSALATFDQAQTEWGGVRRPELSIARAEALLAAGLPVEAAAELRAVVTSLHTTGWPLLEAQARLSLAVCLLASRPADPGRAREEGRAARRLIASADRGELEPTSLYVVAKADLELEGDAPAIDRAVHVASTLRNAGMDATSADLRITAGRAALDIGDLARARTVLGPLAVQDRSRDRDVAGRAQFAQGLLAEAGGDPQRARSCLVRAWATIEGQRELLGATELRAAAAGHAEALVSAGARVAWSSHSAVEMFRWGERGRAAVLRHRPMSAPDQPELAQALARLRWTMAEAESTPGASVDADQRRVIARREAEVRRLTRRIRGHEPAARPVDPADVRERVGDGTFIQMVAVGSRLIAVLVTRTGLRLVDMGPLDVAVAALGSVTFGMRRELTGTSRRRSASFDPRTHLEAIHALDRAVLAPLVLATASQRIVVCPCAALTGVPWSLLPSAAETTITVAPSATAWCRAVDGARHGSGRVVAVAGPGLPDADAEAREVVGVHRRATLLAGPDATVDQVLRAARSADTLHLATHGRLRADNPLFSQLELADGPLTGYDLESSGSAPPTVIMSACSSGAGANVVADETLGLAWILLGLGSSTVVAPLMPIPDASTRPVMVGLHRKLAAGQPPARALHQVLHESADDERAVAGAFVTFGAG